MANDSSLAPALVRGIELLRILQNGERKTLEVLSAEANIPKSSALRLMDTLVHLRLVERDQKTKAYHALLRLGPITDFDCVLQSELQQLANQTKQTAEWWVPGENGMELRHRAQSDDVGLLVHAKVGSTFAPHKAESIPRLGAYRLGLPACPRSKLIHWQENGDEIVAPDTVVKDLEQQLATQDWVVDRVPNFMGVRRLAWLLRSEGQPLGIVCLASPPWPWIEDLQTSFGEILEQAVQHLENVYQGIN